MSGGISISFVDFAAVSCRSVFAFAALGYAGHAPLFDLRVAAPRIDRSRRRAKRGGPGRTRTCNQTVMSGRLSIGFVDFPAVLSDFARVRCGSFASFLVRNWCGDKVSVQHEGGCEGNRSALVCGQQGPWLIGWVRIAAIGSGGQSDGFHSIRHAARHTCLYDHRDWNRTLP